MEQLSEQTESAAPEAAQSPNISQETTTSESSTDEAGLLTPAPESDDEEAEIAGEKYRIPKTLAAHLKELENGRLRQDDYTRKTQEVAEQRKDFESRMQQLAVREQFQQQHIQAVAKVMSLDEQLTQYQKLDWNAIMDASPVEAMKLDRQMRELQQQRAQVVSGIDQSQQQQNLAQQQATTRQHQTALETLEREIKDYRTPEVQKALMETGLKSGFKPEELQNVTDPRSIKLLHKAYLYDKLVAKQITAAKPAAPEAKPITRVTPGAGTNRKSINDPNLSDEEFNRLRRESLNRKR